VSSHQSVHYWNEVDVLSAPNTADFFRLFLAPGVGHCGGGTGPTPVDPLAALVAWVEDGVAPASLPAVRRVNNVVVRERALCPYPQVQVYNGTGDINAASSFTCGDYPAP
jgi:feruloyl esterase